MTVITMSTPIVIAFFCAIRRRYNDVNYERKYDDSKNRYDC